MHILTDSNNTRHECSLNVMPIFSNGLRFSSALFLSSRSSSSKSTFSSCFFLLSDFWAHDAVLHFIQSHQSANLVGLDGKHTWAIPKWAAAFGLDPGPGVLHVDILARDGLACDVVGRIRRHRRSCCCAFLQNTVDRRTPLSSATRLFVCVCSFCHLTRNT